MKSVLMGLALGMIVVALAALFAPAMAQSNEPVDLFLRLAQDDAGYYMTCIEGCDYYNSLGTPEELNRRFTEYHCAVNWSYALQNRHFGWNALVYLVGPNGDTSDPLCSI